MILFKFEWESDGMLNMWQYLYVNIYDEASSAYHLFLLNWCRSNVGYENIITNEYINKSWN